MAEWLSLFSFGSGGWGDEIAAGAWVTLRLALATLPLGIVLGLMVAAARDSRFRVLRGLGAGFVTVFRGLPELLTLFLIYYGSPLIAEAVVGFLGDNVRIVPNPFLSAVLALGLVFGAYAGEVFLGAIRAVPRPLREAAAALGLRRVQAFRLVVFPQVWRLALPGLGNLWMNLLKDTSLVSAIALGDLMRRTNVAIAGTREPFAFYLLALLIYLAFSLASGGAIALVESRARRGLPVGNRR